MFNYWKLIDIFVAMANLWHFYITFVFVHPVESPAKKTLMDSVAYLCSRHQNPMISFMVLACSTSLAVVSGLQYHYFGHKIMLIRLITSLYTVVYGACCMKITASMAKLGPDHMITFEREVEKYDIKNFKPPPISLFNTLLAAQDKLIRPDVSGIDNVPSDTPSLFVMNHSLLGVKMRAFIQTLYREKGFLMRGLADHFHFCTPNGEILKKLGAVDGTRENVDVLMESKQNILVYPGGGNEVLKHSSVPKYSLMWKERLGFARMAIKHGYQIIPCASVGIEDMLDIVADIPTPYRNFTIPVVKTSPCCLQKVYFWFGEPIHTLSYKAGHNNTEYAKEVRDKTKAAVEEGINFLKNKQKEDPERYFTAQMKSAASSVLNTSDPGNRNKAKSE